MARKQEQATVVTSDDAPSRGLDLVMKTVGRPLRALMGHKVLFGTLIGLPVPLYLVLGTSLGLRWWRVPWPGAVSSSLLWLMAADAGLMTVLFGFLAVLFFLGRRQGKISIRDDKRPSMTYTYSVAPFQYGLIAGWGIAAMTGRGGHVLLETGLFLLLASWIVKPWLDLLKRTESEQDIS